MRTKLVETPRPERYIHVVFNAEATAQIPRGAPCILNLSQVPQPTTGTDAYPAGYQDGLQVVLPSSSSATLSNYLLYGVAMANITAQQLGESQVHGLVNFALVNLGTRASSTAASGRPPLRHPRRARARRADQASSCEGLVRGAAPAR